MEIQALSPETIQDTTPTSTDTIPPDEIDSTFSSTCIDLISAPLNSRILTQTDEFFAPASNLLNPQPPIRRPGVFIETGAWYDGWETRRHNPHPPDSVIIRLGPAAGSVRGVEIDTAFFDGNHAEEVEVWGAYEAGSSAEEVDVDERVKGEGYTGWKEVLGRRACGASRRQAWRVYSEEGGGMITHVKLCMFPDGGIARFRLYGQAVPVWPDDKEEEVELSAMVMGGRVESWSDEHFGSAGNLLLPGRGKDMGDGWETRRSRGRGEGVGDWVVVRLGARGYVRRVVVDTLHFRGNFPQGVRVEGVDVGEEKGEVRADDSRWVEVVGVMRCERDKEHVFGKEEMGGMEGRVLTHLKMVILPDGGVKRFRAFGTRV